MKSFFNDDYQFAPATAQDVTECATIEGMRKRIQQYARHEPMVRAVYDSCYYEGRNGEDTMTMLAFHALLDRERFKKLLLDQSMMSLSPPQVLINEIGRAER